MGWYARYVLPKLINSAMQGEDVAAERRFFKQARGVVLEVGAGSGTTIPYYDAALVTKLIALEPSQELWSYGWEQVAKARFPVEYINVGAEEIPLPDNSVDTVVTAYALCSIPNVSAALREMRRVLRPGGQYLFVDHGRAPGWGVQRLQKILTPFTKHFTGGCYLDRDIGALIRAAGFRIQTYTPGPGSKPLLYLYRGVAHKQ